MVAGPDVTVSEPLFLRSKGVPFAVPSGAKEGAPSDCEDLQSLHEVFFRGTLASIRSQKLYRGSLLVARLSISANARQNEVLRESDLLWLEVVNAHS